MADGFTTDLVAAAQFEIEQRERRYPQLVARGRTELLADFQAWCVILKWLATGVFESLDCGGADGNTRIGWPECQAAAEAAVRTRTAWADGEPDQAQREARQQHRSAIAEIAVRVARRRETIDELNAHFAAQRTKGGRKAA